MEALFPDPPMLVTSAMVVASASSECSPIQALGTDGFHAASEVIRRFPGQKLTLADAHGLLILKTRAVRMCWSTDRHLGLTGVPLVIRGA